MKNNQYPMHSRIALMGLVAMLTLSAGVSAQTSSVLSRSWNPRGAAPLLFAQADIVADSPVSGAINAIAAHPTNADILYIGAVNGGVWRTTNATAANPNWTHLTDTIDSLSVGKVVLDPTDAMAQTVLVGAGRFSSFARRGGSRAGLFRSTDSGNTFSALAGFPQGRNVSGLAARGAVINVTVDAADAFTCGNIGLFRSTDTGVNFVRATGLPNGVSDVLVGDPTDNSVLFTTVIFADICSGGVNGLYRSTDTGATWTKVSDAAIDAQLTNSGAHVEMSVGSNDNVYVAIATGGQLSGLFRSGDGGSTWVALDIPGSFEPAFIGIHIGGQGGLHLSVAADPNNDNLVYIAGDRQPRSNNDNGGFPNSIGARNFTGRVFRVDASATAGSQATALTHDFTANGTAPHADSRDMAFLANGHLAQADDGGIYFNPTPQNATGDWFSLIGDLQVGEAHNTDYDANSDILRMGLQDNGTGRQFTTAGLIWNQITSGDGGDVATDVLVRSAMNQSVGYLSFQNLGVFRRRVSDASNNFVSQSFPPLNVVSGDPLQVSFTTPLAVNHSAGGRLLIGGNNGVYESLDQGDTISQLLPEMTVISSGLDVMAYGAADNVDRIYVGGCIGSCTNNGDGADGVFTRDSIGNNLVNILSTTSAIRGVTINPTDQNHAAFIESGRVLMTTDAGANVNVITGDIPLATAGTLNSVFLIDRSSESGFGDQLVVGANRGLYISHEASGFTSWDLLGVALPNAPVYEIRHDAANDLLIAGTLGRGVFSIDLSNEAPVAMADTETTALDTAVVIDVLDNDSDADGDDLIISAADNGTSGTVMIAADNLTLTYMPGNGFNGTDNFSYTVSDGRATASAMVQVTVGGSANAVNDTASMLEDGNTISINVLQNDTGPAPLTITAVSADFGTAVINNDRVDYTPVADFFGTATIDYSISDNQAGTDSAQVEVTVTAVNDAPSFILGSDVNLDEDAAAQSISSYASMIVSGPANESGQQLTLEVFSNNNASLFSVAPAFSNDGTLSFTPVADGNGTALIGVRLSDDGGTDNGGVNLSEQSFSINLQAINDAPSFTLAGNQVVNEDAGSQTVAGFASNIMAGPADESGQQLSFIVGNDNAALFNQAPGIDAATGNLTYIPANNANGSATVTVQLMDNGGSANGGVDTSTEQNFTITVNPVNDAPSFVIGPNQQVLDTAGVVTVSPWATAISAGPADESGQALNFIVESNSSPALFSVQPVIGSDGGLSFVPAVGQSGVASIELRLMDNGGTANTGQNSSAVQSFEITVSNAPATDLQITKVADPEFILDLETLTYTVTASNISTVDASSARIVDVLPVSLDVANASWTCNSSGGASCTASGSGNIDQLVDLPAGGEVVFTITATVLAGTEGSLITNTATVTAPKGLVDSDVSNNTDTALVDTGLFSDGFESQ